MSNKVQVKVLDETQGFLSEFGSLTAEKVVDKTGVSYKVDSPSGDVVVLSKRQVQEVG
jgi:hypothetical protein